MGGSIAYLLLLTLLFLNPLVKLAMYAARNEFYSHILLAPFISGYLLYIRRRMFSCDYRTSLRGAIPMVTIGVAAFTVGILYRKTLSFNDCLTLAMLALVTLIAAGGFLFLGSKWMAAAAFPLGFLVFMIPIPDAAVNCLENGLSHASAEAAAMFFSLCGTPMARDGTVFELPGITIRVAQECSGIHSSLVLFISSLLASHLFLRTTWRRAVLVAFVIPLGILRNGFRILVIGLFCVHVGPQMIDSPVHHHGGPLFFALSLIPMFLLLWYLRREEQPRNLPG